MTESEILMSMKFGGNTPRIQPALHHRGKYEIVLVPNSPADIWRVMDKRFSLRGAYEWMEKHNITEYQDYSGENEHDY